MICSLFSLSLAATSLTLFGQEVVSPNTEIYAAVETIGQGSVGTLGVPELRNVGAPLVGTSYGVEVRNGLPHGTAVVLVSATRENTFLPQFAATLQVGGELLAAEVVQLDGGGRGDALQVSHLPPAGHGLELFAQAAVLDDGAVGGLAFSGALGIRAGASSGVTFRTRSYPVGMTPQLLVAEDFNGDGLADLATVSRLFPGPTSVNNLTVLLGTGRGELAPAQYMLPGFVTTNTSEMVVGDLNGDQAPDLALSIFDGGGVVLLGAGDGTFVMGPALPFDNDARGLALGDLDSDGVLDLIIAAYDDVLVLMGAGDGSFGSPTSYASANDARRVVAGDLNGDSIPDVVAQTPAGLAVFLGIGGGALSEAVEYLTPVGGFAGVQLGYADTDEHLDAILVSDAAFVEIKALSGDGLGGFGAPTVTETPLEYHDSHRVQVGDFDADGLDDVVISGGSGSDVVLMYRAVGDGRYSDPVSQHAENVGDTAIGDLNADGVLDVAMAYGSYVGVRFGSGGNAPRIARTLGGDLVQNWVKTGDINGDGLEDLVGIETAVFGDGEVWVHESEGEGSFAEPYKLPTGLVHENVALTDLDGDGFSDFVVDAGDLFLSTFLSAGGGAIGAAQTTATGLTASDIASADLNADGNADVVLVDGETLASLLGNGDGTFAAPLSVSTQANPAWSLALGHLDKDGILDAAVVTGASYLSLFLGAGDGSFEFDSILDLASINPADVEIADFDGNGWGDIVLTGGPPIGAGVLLSQGDGSYADPVMYATSNQPNGVVVADFDADGALDLGVGHFAAFALLRGQGDGSFAPAEFYALSSFLDVRTGDFNGDGLPDVVGGWRDLHLLFNETMK